MLRVMLLIMEIPTAPGEGLACFGLYYLSLNGQNLVDGSMSTSIVLCDVHLDDTRPNREGKITRFMERREKGSTLNLVEAGPSSAPEQTRSMIDVTFRMEANDMFGEYSFHNTCAFMSERILCQQRT